MVFYTGSVLNKDEMKFMSDIEHDKGTGMEGPLELPEWWRPGDTLRFAHTVKFDLAKTKMVCFCYIAHQRVSYLPFRS